MDAPEPEWMAYGIPAVDKGKDFGFDLLEPEQEPKESEESESKEVVAGAGVADLFGPADWALANPGPVGV